VVREQGDELLADHTSRTKNANFDLSHDGFCSFVVFFVTKKNADAVSMNRSAV
jgi:hypothetical protein